MAAWLDYCSTRIDYFYNKEHKLVLIYCLFFSLNNEKSFYLKNGQMLNRQNLIT